MADNLAQLDYSGRDYQSIKQSLLTKIPLITSKWTDWNQADLGITLLELFTGTADMIGFYLDRMANEVMLPTARIRSSVSTFCKALDYSLSPSIGASVTETFTLASSYPFDITIPKGYRISTAEAKNRLTYSVVQDTVITAGDVTKDIIIGEGLRNEYNYVSSGAASQIITIPSEIQQPPSQTTYVEVYVNGVLWTEEYNTLFGSVQAYLIDLSVPNQTSITFGDGINGTIPTSGANIVLVYWTGNGISGRVGANTLTKIDSSISVGSVTVTFTVNNADSSTGGADKESIEHAKYWAPKMLRTGDRLVTLEDYDTYASTYNLSGVGTISLAKSYWKSSDLYSLEMDIYVLSKDISGNYTLCPSALKTSLLSDINKRRCLGQHVNILDGILYPVLVDLDVYVLAGNNATTVSTSIISAITTYVQSLAFGSSVYVSEIIELAMGVTGVYNVIINSPTSDTTVGTSTVITLTDIVISVF